MQEAIQAKLYLIANIVIGLSIAVIILVLIYIKRKEIQSFFWPSEWIEVEMIELDNNTQSWLEQKNQTMQFRFRGNPYNLYAGIKKEEIRDNDGKVIGTKIVDLKPSIYRHGRLAKAYYYEGNEDPINIQTGQFTGDPQIKAQMEKIQYGDMFERSNYVETGTIIKWAIILGLAILVIYAVIKIFAPAAPTPIPAVQPIG